MGLNVTVPYKQKVIPYLDALNKTAREIQAVNTICTCRREGRVALVGHNTDVIGFRRSLEDHLKAHHTSALVLGSGGSSKAVVYVLKELGIGYVQVSRSAGEGQLSYSELDADQVEQTRLIINTTPLGMYPEVDTFPDLPYKAITDKHLLFDLVYNPEETRFLSLGKEQGAAIVNGYDMLVYQAEGSWEIWNKE
jgi:shikimate dehydrogenase